MGRPLPTFRSIYLLDPTEADLRDEDLAATTPLVLNKRGSFAPVTPGHEPSGWVRLCIALRSSSHEQRAGWWATREDWAQVELGQAFAQAAGMARSGYTVTVVETWARLFEHPPGILSLSGAAWPPVSSWTWLADSLPELARSDSCGQNYLHGLRRLRHARYDRLDRRAWASQLLG